MAFSVPWDESKPAGSEDRSLGDDRIREFKTQMRERLSVDLHFPSTDDGNTGFHEKSTYLAQASDPSQVSTAIALYSKLVGGVAEVHSRHESQPLQQLTLNGKLWLAALTMAGLAQGDVLYFDGTIFNRLAAGSAGQFLKTLGTGANPLWASVGGSFVGGLGKNVRVTNNSSTHAVTLTADELLLDDGAGSVQRFTGVNISADITASAGAGGLDTGPGAEAANTIYYLWPIAKADGTLALMFSASATAPTLPATYTFRSLQSAVGNNNSSNFINFIQQGRYYFFTTFATMASALADTSAWHAIDLTPADMSANAGFVPSALSDYCFGSMAIDATAALFMTNNSAITASAGPLVAGKVGSSGGNVNMPWDLNVITADTLYWLSGNASSAVYLRGFIINKLG